MDEATFRRLMNRLHDLCGICDQDPDIAWKAPMLMVSIVRETLTEEPARSWAERWKLGQPIPPIPPNTDRASTDRENREEDEDDDEDGVPTRLTP